MMARASRLGVCLMNISEAANRQTVERIALAATQECAAGSKILSTVLNIFRDVEYNRSVLTIAAPISHLKLAVCSASEEAYRLIDLSVQQGIHPRLGAVDLIPIYPLTESVSLAECGQIAHSIADHLCRAVPGTSFFLFGDADQPRCRGLVERRKGIGWFKGKPGLDWSNFNHDVGSPPATRYGLTGVGSSHYVMNCNVTIKSSDVTAGRDIARAIRATTSGGLPGVQAMAFHHEGNIEIACNVDSIKSASPEVRSPEDQRGTDQQGESPVGENAGLDPPITLDYTPPDAIERRVEELAAQKRIELVGTALVGFRPEQACQLARVALKTGQDQFWKTRDVRSM